MWRAVVGRGHPYMVRAAAKVFLTGKEKKPEVSEKHVYRISRKIIGFAILISDEI